jgi:predicted nucleotidyltransferase
MDKQQATLSPPPTTETVLQTLREYPNLFEKFHIKTLALFGSIANNCATAESDLDFLVEFSTETTLSLYMDLKFFLEEIFNKPVDLVTKKSLKEIIREQILSEAKYV